MHVSFHRRTLFILSVVLRICWEVHQNEKSSVGLSTEKRVSVPVSIREVAAHAGVSVATVSNVLNRPDIVARPTRDRVSAAIRELGFVRNESARQLRAGRSRTIGLVVLDVANPFFTDVARGVEDEANKAGPGGHPVQQRRPGTQGEALPGAA